MVEPRILKDLSAEAWLVFISWYEDYRITSGKKFLHQLCHPAVIEEISERFEYDGTDPSDPACEDPVSKKKGESSKDFRKRCKEIVEERCK